jgi:hypothetical protein
MNRYTEEYHHILGIYLIIFIINNLAYTTTKHYNKVILMDNSNKVTIE